jgi:hypothetical protein
MSQALKPLSSGLGPRIEALQEQAKTALALTDRVRNALPEPEKNHLISAGYTDGTLTIATDSAAWCTRIRYLEESLRERLAALGEKPFTILKVRVGRP